MNNRSAWGMPKPVIIKWTAEQQSQLEPLLRAVADVDGNAALLGQCLGTGIAVHFMDEVKTRWIAKITGAKEGFVRHPEEQA